MTASVPDQSGLLRELAQQLRSGVHAPDQIFDQYLPGDLRPHSGRHWTPLKIVGLAVRWLREAGVGTVVDIGSGAGKFCVAGAMGGDFTFIGIEQRPRLVEAARSLARLFSVSDRVRFTHGVFGETAIPAADAYYLFNPFGENTIEQDARIDEAVILSRERHQRDVSLLTAFLKGLPTGTHVLTYHGFGGRMPGNFDEIRSEAQIPALLRFWRKSDRLR